MTQIPSLIPKEIEIQRLKRVYMLRMVMFSVMASSELEYFVDTSVNQTIIRDSAFTPTNW
jgi:methane/ammonia monooxygenase subunit C